MLRAPGPDEASHHADREIACNAAPDLEEPDPAFAGIPGIPICEKGHIFITSPYRRGLEFPR